MIFARILFVAILLLSFLLRINILHEARYNSIGDPYRDYLIASHIVNYQEFPIVGSEGRYGPYSNSPLYYYFLSILLLIKDDFMFLQFVNVLLQILNLLFVYLFAKYIFGRSTALLAVAFFGFSETLITSQSQFIWSPNIAQVLVNLSYLLLFLSCYKKSYPLLLTSIFVFIVSFTIYHSVLIALPAFFAIVFLILRKQILRKQKSSILHYAEVLLFSIASWFLLYSPLLLYFTKHPENTPSLSTLIQLIHGEKIMYFDIVQNFFIRMEDFVNSLLLAGGSGILTSKLFGLIFVVWLYYYFFVFKGVRSKIIILLCSACILMLFFISFVTAPLDPFPKPVPFPNRYFIPVFGLFFTITAAIFNPFFSKSLIITLLKFAVLGMFLYALSPNFSLHMADIAQKVRGMPVAFLLPVYVSKPEVETIKNEILLIKEMDGRDNFHFFEFQIYNQSGIKLQANDEYFWVPLEWALDRKLVRSDNSGFRGYAPLTDGTYIFLGCNIPIPLSRIALNEEVVRDCLKGFMRDNKNYPILKQLNPYPLYLAKKVFTGKSR